MIRRVIASGGMGTVYEAIQEQPRRTVAVKLMKRGVVSADSLRRFEFESQLLARLKHPGIAEVYEAGTHDDGHGPVPFFAMEYVPNAAPITTYAGTKAMGIRDRIELFVQVCDAVHHGHQKGIIHRDLKPDNIIVSTEGRPKVIDFGVARATDSDLVYATLQTEYGQLVGTLQYMSPEQVSADPHDIDIRSDVYALGVVLYELMAGKLPYDLKDTAPLEAARRIRDERPPNLSTTSRLLAGDLATITHKALQKDRELRYQSAGELAADLRRFLNHEPITARPPTVMYQIKTFARRNKILVGSTAAVLVVLIAGAITSTVLYVRAESQRAEAERQARRSLAAIGFVTDLVKSTNDWDIGREIKIASLLDKYSEKVGEAFPNDPEIEAAVRTALSESYVYLNDFEKAGGSVKYMTAAREHLEKALDLRRSALGDRHPESLETVSSLAGLLADQGLYAEAVRLRREVLNARRERKGERDPETIAALSHLASALYRQGAVDEALALGRRARDLNAEVLGSSDSSTRGCQLDLAQYARAKGEFAEAERACRSVIESQEPLLPAPPPEQSSATRQLAATFLAQGRFADAAKLYGDRSVPEQFEVSQWLQGRANPADGKPTIIFYFAEWCPYTHRAMPELVERYRRYAPRGLQLVGVAGGEPSNPGLERFVRDWDVKFPVAVRSRGFDRFYKLGGFPMVAIVVANYVVWQGNAMNMDDAMLDGIVAGSATEHAIPASAG
jgi:tetratricopeptide (TPR) repeat protein